MQCKFEKAWVGRCKNVSFPGLDYCEEHSKRQCSCGNQATHDCYETMGGFVCGEPLCPKCASEHDQWHADESRKFMKKIEETRKQRLLTVQ